MFNIIPENTANASVPGQNTRQKHKRLTNNPSTPEFAAKQTAICSNASQKGVQQTATSKKIVNMPPKSKKVSPIRGKQVRFTTGTYAGQSGWVNKAMPETANSIWVIIDESQEAEDDHESLACVRKTSVTFFCKPETIEEYVVQEDPKVAYHLAKLSQALAECGIAGSMELLKIVKVHVDAASVIQLAKGKKAKFSETALRIHGTKENMVQSMKDQAMVDVDFNVSSCNTKNTKN
jgi:hypothetical protein